MNLYAFTINLHILDLNMNWRQVVYIMHLYDYHCFLYLFVLYLMKGTKCLCTYTYMLRAFTFQRWIMSIFLSLVYKSRQKRVRMKINNSLVSPFHIHMLFSLNISPFCVFFSFTFSFFLLNLTSFKYLTRWSKICEEKKVKCFYI